MPKKSNFPEGKKKTIKVDVHADYQKEMTAEITETRKKWWIRKGETESEYIKRIQDENLDKLQKL